MSTQPPRITYTPATAEYVPSSGRLRDDSVSGLLLANALLRQRRRLLLAPLIVATLAVSVSLLLPRRYTVTASFIPQTANPPSRLTGLAEQLGIAGANTDLSQSPGFYSKLLKLREVLGPIADTPYVVRRGGRAESVALSDVLGISARKSPVDRREDTIDALRDEIHVSIDPETQVVLFKIATRDPEVSAEIARRILRFVDAFNLRRRQAQANAERGFSEDRLLESLAELRRAEDAKQAFLLRNRTYQSDPALMTQYERLDRDIGLATQVYTNLQLAYEQSRIDAVRNTPTMLVVQQPELPARADRRYLAVKAIAAFAGSTVVLMVLAMFGAIAAKDGPEDPSAEYAVLIAALKNDLRRLFLRRRKMRPGPNQGLAA